MKEKFKLVIETLHVPDKGYQDNVSVILSWVFSFLCVDPSGPGVCGGNLLYNFGAGL